MFRILKNTKKLNWKYIVGEILLIFLGINLAIWFNNWNETNNIRQNKKIALEKITEEINSNRNELQIALNSYNAVLSAHSEYSKFYNGNTSELITTTKNFNRLQKEFPDYFIVKDSIPINEKDYRYLGTTKIELELPVLSEIAWATILSTNINTELDFDCMYSLETVYSLQRKVKNEIDKASNTLQQGKMLELLSVLNFLEQLGEQLQEEYAEINIKIKNCS